MPAIRARFSWRLGTTILALEAALLAAGPVVITPGTQVAAPASKFIVTIVLGEDSVQVNDAVHFSGTMVNENDAASIESIRIARLPDGYHLTSLCHLPAEPACNLPGKNGIPADIVDRLDPGRRVAFWGTLAADRDHPKSRLPFVVAYWIDKQDFSIVSSTSSITVENRWEHFFGKVYGVLKDLAFPIVLAMFGVILKLMTDKRELRAETWKQMLPQSHDLAGKFYIPLAGAALGMSVEWNRYVAGTPADREQAPRQMFYYIMVFGRLMRDMRYATGGFYFKDRIGEQIASLCWKQVRETYFPTFEENKKSDYFRALRLLEDKQDVDVFLDRLDMAGSVSPLWKSWESFSRVYKAPGQADRMMEYFDLLRAIIVYESNRVYAHWYSLPEPLYLTNDQKKLAEGLFQDGTHVRRVQQYIKQGAN